MTNEKLNNAPTQLETTDWTNGHNTYFVYKRMFDFYHKTSYARNHKLIVVPPMPKRNGGKMFYLNGTYDNPAPNTDVETVITDDKQQLNTDVHDTPETPHTDELRTITYDNGQRDIAGDFNNPEHLIKKSFLHLNAMKRAQTLSLQTNDEYTKLFHENIMYREQNALELSLRILQQNIKYNK
jgi:hypothetical protein